MSFSQALASAVAIILTTETAIFNDWYHMPEIDRINDPFDRANKWTSRQIECRAHFNRTEGFGRNLCDQCVTWNARNKVQFLHSPKAATELIRNSEGPDSNYAWRTQEHVGTCSVPNMIKKNAEQGYYTFAFVRDPFDRLVSAFYEINERHLSGVDQWPGGNPYSENTKAEDAQRRFVHMIEGMLKGEIADEHLETQTSILLNFDAPRIDFIGYVSPRTFFADWSLLLSDVKARTGGMFTPDSPRVHTRKFDLPAVSIDALDPKLRASLCKAYRMDYDWMAVAAPGWCSTSSISQEDSAGKGLKLRSMTPPQSSDASVAQNTSSGLLQVVSGQPYGENAS